MVTTNKVVSRYLTGGAIGDPANLLALFTAFTEKFSKAERSVELLNGLLAEAEKVAATTDETEVFLARKYKKPHRLLELEKEWRDMGIASMLSTAINGGFSYAQQNCQNLFLSILQGLALPPALNRKVQAASRWWSKSSIRLTKRKEWWVRRFYDNEVLLVFPKLLSTFREQVAVAREALAKGKPHGEAVETRLQAGPFTLINTGNFKPEVMETVKEVVEKASKAMTGAGFGKVCYGDIHVSKTITKSTTAAFYLVTSDEMFVRANLKPSHDTLKTVCHELAHRLQFVFLSGKKREIEALYDKIAMSVRYGQGASDMQGWPERGQVVQYKGDTLTVLNVDTRNNKIEFGEPPAPGVYQRKVYTAPLQWWAKNIEGRETVLGENYSGFITDYARRGGPESFIFLCQHSLSGLQGSG